MINKIEKKSSTVLGIFTSYTTDIDVFLNGILANVKSITNFEELMPNFDGQESDKRNRD